MTTASNSVQQTSQAGNTATIAGVQRRFPAWTILELESCHIRQSDGTYIYATVDNYQDPKDPHPYHAEIIREIDAGFGPDFEHLKGRSFDDLISALLWLEDIDIKKYLNKVEPCTR